MHASGEYALLTPAEAADRLRVSRATICRRVADGSLPAVKVGHARNAPVRIAERDLTRLLRPAAPLTGFSPEFASGTGNGGPGAPLGGAADPVTTPRPRNRLKWLCG